jgi:hypothetical protein
LASRFLFSPHPTYPPVLASAAAARAPLPEQAMAYAEPAEPAPAARPTTGSVERNAAVPRPPERRVALAHAQDVAVVFNEAQIASIKDRLALTDEQQRYWPPVAAALRGITRQRAPGAGKTARLFVDPNGADVQRLKSAAITLIMRLREDQKREVRTLAHLMGLESVAAQF